MQHLGGTLWSLEAQELPLGLCLIRYEGARALVWVGGQVTTRRAGIRTT